MMKFRFAFLLVVGLLVASSADAWGKTKKPKGKGSEDAEGDTSPTSDPSTTVVSSTVADVSSTTDASATSVSADTSGTQASGATSAAPGSTVAPGASTAAPAGTTGIPISTTPAPLPDVTVSVLKFSDPTCDSSVCTYTFQAPGNDQAFLATENAILATDRSQYNSLQSAANAKDTNIKQANDAAQQKIKDLQTLLNNIQTNLNSIQANIQVIQNQQIDAQSTLQFVEKFIDTVNAVPDNCLYQKCLKPTTPAPPTTTPTPSPTTPPSPCLNFTCPSDPTGGLCSLDSSNKPFCTNCLSNFDGYGHCDTIACNAGGSGFVLSSTNNGTLYSTGYNQTDPLSSLIPANADCRWQLNGTLGSFQIDTTGTLNLTCLVSGKVTMYMLGDGGVSQLLSSTQTARTLNSSLKKLTNPAFTLTSTGSESSYCSIPLVYTAPTPTPATVEVEQKKNGFFSWLMGN